LQWEFKNHQLSSFELTYSKNSNISSNTERYTDDMIFMRFYIQAIEHFLKGKEQDLFLRIFGDHSVPFSIDAFSFRDPNRDYVDLNYEIGNEYNCDILID